MEIIACIGADISDGEKDWGSASPVEDLDAAQQGRQELVDDPRLEIVPEISSKLVVYCNAVSLGGKCGFLYSPEILHVVDPN